MSLEVGVTAISTPKILKKLEFVNAQSVDEESLRLRLRDAARYYRSVKKLLPSTENSALLYNIGLNI